MILKIMIFTFYFIKAKHFVWFECSFSFGSFQVLRFLTSTLMTFIPDLNFMHYKFGFNLKQTVKKCWS